MEFHPDPREDKENRSVRHYKETYIFNFLTQEFTKGPDLLEPRAGHACGLIIDTGTGIKKTLLSALCASQCHYTF